MTGVAGCQTQECNRPAGTFQKGHCSTAPESEGGNSTAATATARTAPEMHSTRHTAHHHTPHRLTKQPNNIQYSKPCQTAILPRPSSGPKFLSLAAELVRLRSKKKRCAWWPVSRTYSRVSRYSLLLAVDNKEKQMQMQHEIRQFREQLEKKDLEILDLASALAVTGVNVCAWCQLLCCRQRNI